MKFRDKSTGLRPVIQAAVLLAPWLSVPAMAAAPPAGSVIGNQATATYKDASGQTKTSTSNLVETTVQQVGSFTLGQPNTKTASVGNTVYMPHLVTNTGNGTDSFVLTTADSAGTFGATSINIYADSDGDGVPDSTTPLATGLGSTFTTPAIPSGGTFGFVVSMTIPSSATEGQNEIIDVTATAGTPGLYGTTSQSNTDTLTVTAGAAFQVNKTVSASQGPVGTTLTYTLTYKNTGSGSGTLALYDLIGSGATAGFEYVADSAIWSAGSTALADAYASGVPDATVGAMEMHYKAITTGAETVIQSNITNVGPNVTGSLTFKVLVLDTARAGTTTTTNTAYFGADDDANPEDNSPSTDSTLATNPSGYKVLASRGVVIKDSTAGQTDGTDARAAPEDDDSSPNADLEYKPLASPGETLLFRNTVWNTGNSSDVFNVTASALAGGAGYGAWPAGTTFELYKPDGASPLLDTNGDGVADTGALPTGGSYAVVLKVTLPAGACSGGCPTGPFDVQLTATSVAAPSQSNTTYDRLGALVPPTGDIANSSGAVDATVNQDAIGAAPTTTNSVLAGQQTTFDLYIRNEGTQFDSYSLSYSGTNAFSPATNLPSGWTLEFRNLSGTVINSVASLAPGTERHIKAVVTVPATATAQTVNVYFRIRSQASGATDAKWDAVTVIGVDRLTLSPNGSNQIYPGGTVVYSHLLANTGNTRHGDGVTGESITFTASESLADEGWTYVLYLDVDGDGVLGAADTLIPQVGGVYTLAYDDADHYFAPGEQIRILVKVYAPAGAAPSSTDVLTLSATAVGIGTTSNSVTDTSTVITGQVRLVKIQANDDDCDGAADGTFSSTPLTVAPGKCLVYRVTATNEGLGDVTNLVISDSLPAYTTQFPVDNGNPSTVNPVCSQGTGRFDGATFSCSAAQLKAATTTTLTFSVRVQD